MLLVCSTHIAAEQYTQAQCDDLTAQSEQIRKRMNQGDAAAAGNLLNERDRELLQLINKHCSSSFAPASQASVLSPAPPTIGQQPQYESMPVYTSTNSDQPQTAQHNRVRVDKNFHQHFTWFGIAFVVFVGLSSWIIWRK